MRIATANKSKVVESLENNEVNFAMVSILPSHLNIDKLDLPQNKLIAFSIILFLYEPFMCIKGGTLGHRAMKIQVRKQSNEAQNLNVLRSYIRFILKITCGPFLGFKWIVRSKNLAIHDFLSGSVVVNKNHTI